MPMCRPILFAAIFALVSLGACAGDRCRIAARSWPQTLEPMLPDAHEPNVELAVDPAGCIRWRGFMGERTLSLAELREALPIVDDFSVRPWLIVRASADADCESVRAVRAELERLRMCAEGLCIDGAVWDARFGASPSQR